jgi:hypothetical protein
MCAAYHQASLADGGEDRVAIGLVEKQRTSRGFLEDGDRVDVFVRMRRHRGKQQPGEHQHRRPGLHALILFGSRIGELCATFADCQVDEVSPHRHR